MPRRPVRLNHIYLTKMLDALERVGIDYRELPREFVHMAWEERLSYLQLKYNVACCVRCKLPYPDQEMDIKYSLCLQCSVALHRKQYHDSRIGDLMVNRELRPPTNTLQDNEVRQLLNRPRDVTTGLASEQYANDILDRASKRSR